MSLREELAAKVAALDGSDAALRRFIGGRTFVLLLIAVAAFVCNLLLTTLALVSLVCVLVIVALAWPQSLRFWQKASCCFWRLVYRLSLDLWRCLVAYIFLPAHMFVRRIGAILKNITANRN